MSSEHRFQYLQAVVFDWAGTTIDYGSRAPAAVFQKVFALSGVDVTTTEVREPMGRAKRDHIAAILAMPRVKSEWTRVRGTPPSETDVDRLYAEFLPLQKEVLARHADVIPGVPELLAACRQRGLKIGSTTGYTRELIEVLLPLAAVGGFDPDVSFGADDVAAGRPAPYLLFRAAEALGVYPMRRVVAVDDTPVGIAAGRHAGAWTVAVVRTGNELGLSAAEVAALPERDLQNRLGVIRRKFSDLQADFVIDSVADLLPVLETIESRLAASPTERVC